ncbi:hypothetical protein [Xenorhabdus ishibashii]|uniref:Uncharacterized protein n=1 Tax=Xenorhabdus ishibashii TaxID=1034471 RepID=A0A2D0K832_9GAMM|nr:hypothetical protein [Xenorhabdus ishibashii]PHM59535.1 hypothetical protein Xish_03654 [Xenorhabdus ishibashii]
MIEEIGTISILDIKNKLINLNWGNNETDEIEINVDEIRVLSENIYNIIESYSNNLRTGIGMACIYLLLTEFRSDVDDVSLTFTKYNVTAIFLMDKFLINANFNMLNVIN